MRPADLLTWLVMFAALVCIAIWGGMTFDFQRGCNAACAPARSITPYVGFEEVCFCDEGDGRWRRTSVHPQ